MRLDSAFISIALLNKEVDCTRLAQLQDALNKHFAYYEILLINPIFSSLAKNSITPPPYTRLIRKLSKS
ncbi:hypothetical protein [Helicobacter himalayensis]|uniref:hypothetical protein n=1 Tax=Helicobacter himalayensis TaxID=1591088 RepID=UPI003D6FF797